MDSTPNLETLDGLLTARVVCKHFRLSATCHLKDLNIEGTELEQALKTNFAQFSGLRRLGVSVHEKAASRSHLLGDPRIAPLITRVDLEDFYIPSGEATEALAPLMQMPKLRSLTLGADLDVVHLLPPSLEELELWSPLSEDVSPLTRLSAMTRLEFALALSGPAESVISLGDLPSLRALRLECEFLPLGVIRIFTKLTSLALHLDDYSTSVPIFSDLIFLTGLADLTVSISWAVTRDDLACLSHLTKLTSLDLSGSCLSKCASGSSALAPLTGLARLWLSTGDVGMSILPHVNVEGLRCLGLFEVYGDISVLRRAMGVTELAFACGLGWGWGDSRYELGPVLTKMTRLRSLDLDLSKGYESPKVFQLSPVLRALTGLTCLRYAGNFTVDSDMQACASLPLLRSLGLCGYNVTVACLPALQAMSALTELTLDFTDIREDDLMPEVRAALDVERLLRGWPCLKLSCFSW